MGTSKDTALGPNSQRFSDQVICTIKIGPPFCAGRLTTRYSSTEGRILRLYRLRATQRCVEIANIESWTSPRPSDTIFPVSRVTSRPTKLRVFPRSNSASLSGMLSGAHAGSKDLRGDCKRKSTHRLWAAHISSCNRLRGHSARYRICNGERDYMVEGWFWRFT
jgi:hypothetical protein